MRGRLAHGVAVLVAAATLVACSGAADPSSAPAPALTAPASSVNAPDPGNVAVLVVDDFGFGREGSVGAEGDNCVESAGNVVGSGGAGNVVGSGGAGNVVGSGGAGDDVLSPPRPHGVLVYEVLSEELTSLLSASPKATAVNLPQVPTGSVDDWSYTVNGVATTVRLVPVHTSDYTTTDVIGGIHETVRDLAAAGYKRFVLNLSFVVFPCDVDKILDPISRQILLDGYLYVLDVEPNVGTALMEYLDELGTGGARPDLSNVAAPAVTRGVRTDPRLLRLRPYLFGAYYEAATRNGVGSLDPIRSDAAWTAFVAAVRGDGLEVIPVASAGNGIRTAQGTGSTGASYRLGVDFPFAPAVWDSVVAVGADPATVAVNWFNKGEVSHDARALDPKYEGTSFAAPRVSAREAVYLVHTGLTRCGNDDPPLGYVGVPTAGAAWENWPESDWRTNVCKDWFV